MTTLRTALIALSVAAALAAPATADDTTTASIDALTAEWTSLSAEMDALIDTLSAGTDAETLEALTRPLPEPEFDVWTTYLEPYESYLVTADGGWCRVGYGAGFDAGWYADPYPADDNAYSDYMGNGSYAVDTTGAYWTLDANGAWHKL